MLRSLPLFLYFLFFGTTFQAYTQSWQAVGNGTNNSSHGMLVYNGKLVDLGSFNNPCNRVALWNGTSWECLGGGVGIVARAGVVWNGNLVVVGDFWNVQQPCTNCNGIAMWNGTQWTNIGAGFNNDVLCVTVWNGDLVAAGDFTQSNGQPCSRIAKWTGTSWQQIGPNNAFNNDIRAITEFEDELWVGGDFSNVGGCTSCDGLVKWNGTSWVGGNSGVDLSGGVDTTVRVLYVSPTDGRLYMGGHFRGLTPNGVYNDNLNGVAAYDGSDWFALDEGVGDNPDDYVRAISEYNGKIVVGGYFTTTSGISTNKIARFNLTTQTWSAMGQGFNGVGVDEYVKSAAVWNGILFAGGAYTIAESGPMNYIAQWYEPPIAPPIASINQEQYSACSGSCVTFSDNSTYNPTSWNWSFPGGNITSSTLQNPPNICYANPGTYTVTLQACNSSGCNTSTATISITSAATVSVNNTTICSGLSAVLTANPSIQGGSFLWSPGGQTTSSITVAPTSTTNYTVTYNSSSCGSTTATGTVTVASAAPTVTVNNATICSGATTTLTAQASVSGGTYSWYPGGQSTPSISVSPTTTTTYTVTYTVGNCSSNPANSTVTVNQAPNVNAGFDQTICAGQNVTLNGTGANSYSWSNGVTNGVAFSPTSTQTYTVTGTNVAGCSNTDQVVVTVTQAPNVNAGSDQTICAGQSVTLSGSGANSYTWSNGVTNGVAFSPTSTQTYTVTGTNAVGCSNTDQVVVTVTQAPNVSAGVDQTICAGQNVTLNGTGANSYSWSNGVTNGVAFSPTSTQTYTVTGTNVAGCSNTDQVVVTVTQAPNVNAGSDQTICAGQSVTLSGSGANSYTWSNGVTNGVAFSPTSTQTYTVTGTNAVGCSNTDQVVVTVTQAPNVSAGVDQTICAGQSVTLSGTGANSYTWSNGVTNGVSFLPTSTQTYTVTGTNAAGCSGTDQVIVNVSPAPSVNAGSDQTICAGQSVILSGSGANSYTWSNGITNGVSFLPTSTQTYTVTGTNATGCSTTDQVVVTVNQNSYFILNENALDSFTLNGETYLQSGSYTQILSNALGCDSIITLNLTIAYTGINQLKPLTYVLYPNPATDQITIKSDIAVLGSQFSIYDQFGRKLLQKAISNTITNISLVDFSSGIYTLYMEGIGNYTFIVRKD